MACQAGAEAPLKAEIARRYRDFRFAFSRPGFVTFKVPDDLRNDRQFELKSVFARTSGFSIDRISGPDVQARVGNAWGLLSKRYPPESLAQFQNIHVWERDRRLPGDDGFEPGISPVAREAGEQFIGADPSPGLETQRVLNGLAATGKRVLDIVLVEPDQWWLGWHRAHSGSSTWPGGVPDISLPEGTVSRTYLKMVESLDWSEFPVQRGDACVEIGSAPGGSCQALLERGLSVTGVDPAEMDAALLANPYFTHLRARAKDLKRRMFSDFRWLMADASVAPNYTLDTVEAIVTDRRVKLEGLLLTLKMTGWDQAGNIPEYTRRVRSWGYRYVRARQLAYNRREICIAASDLQPESTDNQPESTDNQPESTDNHST